MLNKKHLNSCHCVQPKWHMHGCSRWEIVVKQIFNLDHSHYTLQKYVVFKTQVEIGHKLVHRNLLKHRGFYRLFPNINFISIYSHFLQKILSHPLCYFKGALLKARKTWIFKILRPTLSAQTLDLTEFQNYIDYKRFLRN